MKIKARTGLWLWLGLPLVLALLIGKRVALFIFYVNTGALLISMVWCWAASKLRLTYRFKQHGIHQGQPLLVEVRGVNGSWLPLAIHQQLVLSKKGWGLIKRGLNLGLAPRQEKIITEELTGLTRGIYTLTEAHWEAGDLYGLFSFINPQRGGDEVVVYPPVISLENFMTGLHESLLGNVERVAGQDVFNTYGVRDYYPGDKLNHIHWKVFARKGSLCTKEFQHEYTQEGWLIIHLPKGAAEKGLEMAVTVTASLAGHLLPKGFRVGMLMGGTKDVILAPDQGERRMRAILDALARVEYHQQDKLSAMVKRYAHLFKELGSVILVAPGPDEDVIKVIELLRIQGVFRQAVFTGQGKTEEEQKWFEGLNSQGVYFTNVHGESMAVAMRG